MKFKVFAPAFAALAIALVAPAARAQEDCSTIEDAKDKKKCEKKAASAAKADARSTPYTPSQLSPALAAWDAPEANPFATDAYRCRVTTSGIASVDEYLGKAFKMQAIVVGSRFIVDQIAAGNADAVKAAPALVPMLAEVPVLGQQLVQEGQGLVTSLPSQLAGPDALKLPKALAAVKDGITALTSAVEEAPKVAGSLGSAVSNPGAAAGAAVEAGAEGAAPQ